MGGSLNEAGGRSDSFLNRDLDATQAAGRSAFGLQITVRAIHLTGTEAERTIRAMERTLRAILVGLALLFSFLPTAFGEPVYFLIDASKSMDEAEQEAAAKFVAAEKAKLPTGTLTSTTLFGTRENGGADCGEVTVNPLRTVPEDVPAPYTGGDFTPAGNALRVALEAAATNGGRVVIISDGADTCEVDVCEVVRSHLRRNPEALRPEFKPIGAADDTVDKYGCFISASRGVESQNTIGGGKPPAEAASHLWWIIPLSVFNVLCFASVPVFVLLTMAARSRDLGAQVKGLIDTGNAPKASVRVRLYFFSCLPATLPAMIILLVWWLAPNALAQGWDAIWWFMNLPSGSMLLPAALLGFCGWALVAVWDLMAKRRQLVDAQVKIKLEEQRRLERETLAKAKATAREKERSRRSAVIRADLLKRIAGHRDDARELERNKLDSLSKDPTDPSMEAIVQKVALVADRLEEAIANISDNQRLQRFDVPRTDYCPVLRTMTNLDLITPDVFRDLTDIFRCWSRYTGGEGALSKEDRTKIESFDPQRIKTD